MAVATNKKTSTRKTSSAKAGGTKKSGQSSKGADTGKDTSSSGASKTKAAASKSTTSKTPTTSSAAAKSATSETGEGKSSVPASGSTSKKTSTTSTATGNTAPGKTETPKSAATKAPAAKSTPTKPDTSKPDTSATATGSKDTAKEDTAKSDTSKSATASATGTTGEKAADKDAVHLPATSPVEDGKGGAGFGALLLGGVLAAAIGFGAAYWILPQMGVLEQPGQDDLGDVQAQLEAQSQDIEALSERLTTTENITPPDAPDLSGLEAAVSEFSARIDTIDSRLTDLENRPVPSGGTDGGSASSGEITALRDALAAQKSQIDSLMADAARREEAAQASARDTLRRAALTRIQTALDTGSPFAAALSDLRETGQDVPDALAKVADSGAPSLDALQASFPDAARAALSTARANGTTGDDTGGVASFLNAQLGVRSLEPREGDDPDAILSRAEAALRDGRLTDTMAELEALPEEARTELGDWIGQATIRMDATHAAETIGDELN